MFCNNCGKGIPDDSNFCQYCGNTIKRVIKCNACGKNWNRTPYIADSAA